MQWLVDVLMKKQMDVPWRHAHLPSVFIDGCRPLLGKVRRVLFVELQFKLEGQHVGVFIVFVDDLLVYPNLFFSSIYTFFASTCTLFKPDRAPFK